MDCCLLQLTITRRATKTDDKLRLGAEDECMGEILIKAD